MFENVEAVVSVFPDKIVDEIPTRNVVLVVSGECNLRCRYCYEHFKRKGEMSLATAKRVVRDEFRGIANQKGWKLRFEMMGGEPLLNFPLVRELSEWMWLNFDDSLYEICIQTNGTVLTENSKRWLSENRAKISVSCSFDGFSEMNEYNRGNTAENIGYFRENWPNEPVSVTLFPDSVKWLHKTVSEMRNRGYAFTVQPAEGIVWDKEFVSVYVGQMDLVSQMYLGDYRGGVESGLLSFDPLDYFQCASLGTTEFCGHRQLNVAYDVEGRAYFCHLFTPLAMGRQVAERAKKELSGVEYVKIDSQCELCPVKMMCRPCPGYRYKLRKDINSCVERITICNFIRAKAFVCAKHFMKEFEENVRRGGSVDNDDVIRAKKAIDYIEYYQNSKEV